MNIHAFPDIPVIQGNVSNGLVLGQPPRQAGAWEHGCVQLGAGRGTSCKSSLGWAMPAHGALQALDWIAPLFNHLNGVPSPRAATLQVPRQCCPVPEPGQCCAPRGFANLCFASLGVGGSWQCSSQRQETTTRQSLRNRDTSCPGDGPCHPPVKPSTHGSHTEPHLGQHHSPGTKCCRKSPIGARKEPLVGLSAAVPRQGAARDSRAKELLWGSAATQSTAERGWVLLGCGWLRLCVRDFNLILDVVCPPTV